MLELQNEILNELKSEILPEEFEKFIKPMRFNEKFSKESFIVYNVTNEYIAKFIQTKYGEKIEKLYENKTGIRPIINITSKTKVTKEKQQPTKEVKKSSANLNPNYNFDNFITGDSNRFAFTCAKSVAQNPGSEYNPLFIYGPSGLGKTHLLQSIGNYCIANDKVVICVTSEMFANDLSFNIANKTQDKFKEKYRNCDVLLIDDIQFLASREKAKEEFFNTFNELKYKNCQIVLTNDKPPKYIKGFEERLISRFESGLIADITPPDLETKIAIIKKKSDDNKITLTRDVVEYIATNMGDNIREIEGALSKLNAFSKLLRNEINLDFVKTAMQDQIKEKKEKVDLNEIIECVAKELNIKPSLIKGKNRSKNVVEARRISIWLSKILTTNSMPQIATFFGLKDHSAVSYNIKKTGELIDNDEFLKIRIEELKNRITSKENQ